IERLWRDVSVAVTSIYYNIPHTLEDSHLLDISSSSHLFSCHYVFLKASRPAWMSLERGGTTIP
ncbi:hypothetical protein ABG768_008216, partial [Culter alburnus]